MSGLPAAAARPACGYVDNMVRGYVWVRTLLCRQGKEQLCVHECNCVRVRVRAHVCMRVRVCACTLLPLTLDALTHLECGIPLPYAQPNPTTANEG